MQEVTNVNQSQFPAKFLFSATREQMDALDELTNSIPGADRLGIARVALAIGMAYIAVTGVAPLTADAVRSAAKEMTTDTTKFTIPVDALGSIAPVAGAVNGQAQQ
jgi:hypothetical protein